MLALIEKDLRQGDTEKCYVEERDSKDSFLGKSQNPLACTIGQDERTLQYQGSMYRQVNNILSTDKTIRFKICCQNELGRSNIKLPPKNFSLSTIQLGIVLEGKE